MIDFEKIRTFFKNEKVRIFYNNALILCAQTSEFIFIKQKQHNRAMRKIKETRKLYPTDLTDVQWNMHLLILGVSKQWQTGQSVKSMEEKTTGRKRHIVVDTMGNLLAVTVYAANIHDTKSRTTPRNSIKEKRESLQPVNS